MNKKRVTYIGLIITSSLAAYAIFNYFRVKDYKESIEEMTINPIDPAKVKDGVYFGTAELTWVAADVEVTVSNGTILKVNLTRHKQERGEPAEVLIGQIVTNQTLNLDTITGATASGKVILKSVENALTKGLKQNE